MCVCVLTLPIVWGVLSVAVFAVVSAGYYLMLYRLLVCIFSLAQLAEGKGKPVGRPSVPPEEYPPDLSEYQDDDGILIF